MSTSSEQNLQPASGASNTTNKKSKRVALAPHREEIERWVAQGHSDAWIASALGTSPSSVQSFRSRHDIYRVSGDRGRPASASRDGAEQDQSVYEGVLEHGEEDGYGLWLDPAVADDPLFERGFAGVSDINVSIEKNRIVLTPADGANSADTANVSAENLQNLQGVQPDLTDFEGAATLTLSSNRETGRLKFFNAEKGFGFIIREGGEEIFFHRSELETGGEPAQGEVLSYEVSSNDRGLKAVDVRAAS